MIAVASERDRMVESNSVRSCAVCAVPPVLLLRRLAREVHYDPDYRLKSRELSKKLAGELHQLSGIGSMTSESVQQPGTSETYLPTAWSFDSDGAEFRLAAEALRIRMAARFDPMLAVSTSELEPLPHQLKAVYGELLARTPLRFLLADEPGAGKTIMAGLYIKELMLRGDLARCLIIAPGGLVGQWYEELLDKFNLYFELLTRQLVDAAHDSNVFDRYPLLIARMDQLSRSEELTTQLQGTDWDLVVVDEAHRMSARYFGAELKTTRRYQLGQTLGRVARHLLLMTATPHAGKEEDFQLFLALLDADRFEGRYREGVHSMDTGGLMRRMVKEELLTFEGKPLFPERIASTVPYQLSRSEAELYEAVTQYVREEMNRADRLDDQGDKRRGTTVGFALTVLQRRLASSPEAILRSLERRQTRLERRRQEILPVGTSTTDTLRERLFTLLGKSELEALDDELDELSSDELETLEDDVVDAATAARTVAELDTEIEVLADLVELARHVRYSSTDRKWTELRTLLLDNQATRDVAGNLRKIIVFTEHRDTLNYLVEAIRALLGRDDAVATIHGGVRREERRRVQELFTQDRDCVVLVATDAAGEGLNLQRAHLMVNYDLPWNPNKIEQRLGRIHRIGQNEVCHLWNLVANNTREGAVFRRLLDKVEQQRKAYQGKVFDVLGEAFEGRPLRQLLLDAIRYGDRPEVRARLDEVIDATVGAGVEQLITERALHHDTLAETDVAEMRLHMEEARARRLQPHYIKAFFFEAFRRLGGRIAERETGRYEISHVPAEVRDHDRRIGLGALVLRRYERVTFERSLTTVVGKPRASLLAPGHPLLDAVVDLAVERYASVLEQGTILIDRASPDEEARLLVAVTQEIIDGNEPARTISKRFDFLELEPNGGARVAGPAPHLDYEPPTAPEREAATSVSRQPWLDSGVEQFAVGWAADRGLTEHLQEVRERVESSVNRTRAQVRQRLIQEINYWDTRHAELLDGESAGRRLKIKPETADRRARDLEWRLEHRLAELDRDQLVQARPPQVAGAALVIPQGLLDRLDAGSDDALAHARDTAEVERRAIDAVLATERAQGREPVEMAHNNRGYDIRSQTRDGHWLFLEVKGRIAGAEDFYLTRSEVLTGKTAPRYRLALVAVSPTGPEHDEVRYLAEPFTGIEFGSFAATGLRGDWNQMWARGRVPE